MVGSLLIAVAFHVSQAALDERRSLIQFGLWSFLPSEAQEQFGL